jgi:hypothetical protein
VLLEPEVPVDVVHRKEVDIQTSCWVQQVERWHCEREKGIENTNKSK